jgi:hypothetical protein
MDPISLVINVVRACDAIHTAVLQARCNQAQCALLDRRLQAIRPAIERVRTALETSYAGGTGVLSGDEQALVLSLVSFDEVVRAARTCIESFAGDSWGQRAWKLINREGFQMEFRQLNDRLTQAAGDLQLHFAALAHYATPPATNALEEGLRLGNSDDQQAAASEDLKQLRGQLSQIAEQVAAADEAAEERAHVVVHKLESAEEVAKRRHDSVRSHLSQLESALAMLVRQAQQGSSNNSASSTLSPTSSLPASVPPSPTVKKARQKLTAEDLQELEIPASDILLQEQIGSGGFGDVYRGQWVSRDMQVAVKKLRISNLSAQAHSDLMREVTMLRRTRLPTVVALLGIVRTEGSKSFMLVLEYMNLGSLWDVLRKPAPTTATDERQTTGHSVAADADASVQATQRGIPFGKSMTLEQRLHLMYSACLSVSHLHLSVPPIMHCDIKRYAHRGNELSLSLSLAPSDFSCPVSLVPLAHARPACVVPCVPAVVSLNFLLSLKGGSGSSALELKVADFGLSRTKRETTIQSTRGDVTTTGGNPQGGSLMWKAPERFRGFGAFTFACDVYSLAIVMWEIATVSRSGAVSIRRCVVVPLLISPLHSVFLCLSLVCCVRSGRCSLCRVFRRRNPCEREGRRAHGATGGPVSAAGRTHQTHVGTGAENKTDRKGSGASTGEDETRRVGGSENQSFSSRLQPSLAQRVCPLRDFPIARRLYIQLFVQLGFRCGVLPADLPSQLQLDRRRHHVLLLLRTLPLVHLICIVHCRARRARHQGFAFPFCIAAQWTTQATARGSIHWPEQHREQQQ